MINENIKNCKKNNNIIIEVNIENDYFEQLMNIIKSFGQFIIPINTLINFKI